MTRLQEAIDHLAKATAILASDDVAPCLGLHDGGSCIGLGLINSCESCTAYLDAKDAYASARELKGRLE